jgi:hemoglobin-like flavoprotein
VIRPLLLKESFDLVTKVDFAHKFYENLFATYPTTMELFAKTDMRRQENSLMATLAVVIEGVTRGENLTPVIHALGAKHAHKGALAEHYPLVGAILLQTFAEVLGKRFTEQMQEAWEEAYEIISTEMINGARKEGETTVQAG